MSDKPALSYTKVETGSAIADLGNAMYLEFRAMPRAEAGQVLTYLVSMIFINSGFKDCTPTQTFDTFAEGIRLTIAAWEKQG